MKKLLKKPEIVFLLVVLLLALAAAPFLVRWANPHREGATGNGHEVVFYHMNDCGHCDNMMEEWEKFVRENTDINTRKVEKNDIPSDVEISSFPTIHLLNQGQQIAEFNDNRTAVALKQFYDDNVN